MPSCGYRADGVRLPASREGQAGSLWSKRTAAGRSIQLAPRGDGKWQGKTNDDSDRGPLGRSQFRLSHTRRLHPRDQQSRRSRLCRGRVARPQPERQQGRLRHGRHLSRDHHHCPRLERAGHPEPRRRAALPRLWQLHRRPEAGRDRHLRRCGKGSSRRRSCRGSRGDLCARARQHADLRARRGCGAAVSE